MRPKPLLTLGLVAVAGVLAAPCTAASSTHSTSLRIEGFLSGYIGGGMHYGTFGTVSSQSKHCIAGRKVKTYVRQAPGDPFKPLDVGRTSSNGAWVGIRKGSATPSSFKAKVTKSTYGPRHHRQTCSPQTKVISIH